MESGIYFCAVAKIVFVYLLPCQSSTTRVNYPLSQSGWWQLSGTGSRLAPKRGLNGGPSVTQDPYG